MNTYVADAGEFFTNFIKRVKREMWQKGQEYAHCSFNGITVTVSSDSNLDDICVIYDLKCELNRLKRMR